MSLYGDELLAPRLPFFAAFSNMSNRGELLIGGDLSDGNYTSADVNALLDIGKEYARDHGGVTYIYQCVPVKRIARNGRRVVIDELAPMTPDAHDPSKDAPE